MLRELRIGQLGLVDALELRPTGGLTVLTGETGAGKSMIAGAVAILAGEKAAKDQVREGSGTGWVEGLFDLADRPLTRKRLQALGVAVGDDGRLLLRRELSREGRGRVLIDGRPSSLALLARIGPLLLRVQSQHQQTELDDPGFPLRVLDELLDCTGRREALAALCTRWRELDRDLADLVRDREAAAAQLDIWSYQLAELEAADLDPDEAPRLREALATARHAAQIRESAAAAHAALDDAETGVRAGAGRAQGALERVGGLSARLDALLADLRDAGALLDDASVGLERFLDGLDADPGRIDELAARLALYEDLQRKFRQDVPGLLAYRDLLSRRLAEQSDAGAREAELTRARDAAAREMADAAAELRRRRRDGCGAVSRLATDVIRPLALPELELDFAVAPRPGEAGDPEVEGTPARIGRDGADEVALSVRTNRGEAPGAVARIASGGEKSRIYLGMLSMLRRSDEPPLILLDEIDAGLGNDAALPVAGLLRRLARDGQIVCITHLPTLAAHGRVHWAVQKRIRDRRTVLEIRELAGETRVAELARLLGGDAAGSDDADAQRRYALDLLAAHAG